MIVSLLVALVGTQLGPIVLDQVSPGTLTQVQAVDVNIAGPSGRTFDNLHQDTSTYHQDGNTSALPQLAPKLTYNETTDVKQRKSGDNVESVTVTMHWTRPISDSLTLTANTTNLPGTDIGGATPSCTASFSLAGYRLYVVAGKDSFQPDSGYQPIEIKDPGTLSAEVTLKKADFAKAQTLHTFPYRVDAVYNYKNLVGSCVLGTVAPIVLVNVWDLFHGSFQGVSWDFSVASNISTVTLDNKGRIHKASEDSNYAESASKGCSIGGEFWEDYVCNIIEGFKLGVWQFYTNTLNTLLGFGVKGAFIAPYLQFKDASFVWARNLNQLALNLVNYLIVLTLIFLSFVNILQIQVDTYGIKKVMPTLVYGVILANFANLISRLIADFADVLTASLVGDPGVFMANIGAALGFGQATLSGAAAAIGLGGLFLGAAPLAALAGIAVALIFLFPMLLLVYLYILFWIRWYLVVGLTALAPLAFAALGTPLTAGYFKQWWDLFIRWVFMAPVAYFLLRIATFIVVKDQGSVTVSETQTGLTGFFVATACVYLAVRVPFQLGGDLMNQWGGLVHKVGLWGAKKADSYLGDITEAKTGRRWGFRDTIMGIKKQAEVREQERQLRGEAMGQGLYEAATQLRPAIASQVQSVKVGKGFLGQLKRAAGGTGQAFGHAKDTLTQFSEQAKLQGVQELVTKGKLGKEKSEDQIMPALKAAIDSGRYENAKDLVVQAAGGGHLDRATAEAFFEKFIKEADITNVSAALVSLSRDADETKAVFENMLTKDSKGNTALASRVDPHAAQRNAEKALNDRTRRMSGSRLAQELDFLVKTNLVDEQGKLLDADKLTNDFQRALIKKLANHKDFIGANPGMFGAAKEALKAFDVKDLEVSESDIGTARLDAIHTDKDDLVRRAVLKANSFGGLGLPAHLNEHSDWIQVANKLSASAAAPAGSADRQYWEATQKLFDDTFADFKRTIEAKHGSAIASSFKYDPASADKFKHSLLEGLKEHAGDNEASRNAKRAVLETINNDAGTRAALKKIESLDMGRREILEVKRRGDEQNKPGLFGMGKKK